MNRPAFQADLEVACRNGTGLPLAREIVLCLNTGWAWWELMATPEWVVEDLLMYFRAQGAISRERRAMRGK